MNIPTLNCTFFIQYSMFFPLLVHEHSSNIVWSLLPLLHVFNKQINHNGSIFDYTSSISYNTQWHHSVGRSHYGMHGIDQRSPLDCSNGKYAFSHHEAYGQYERTPISARRMVGYWLKIVGTLVILS